VRRKSTVLAVAGMFLVLACGAAWGAGFALYEFSARGNALGGTMVGRADDPSAIAFNPAGITQIPGTSYMIGASFIMPRGTLTETSSGTAVGLKEHTFIPPHIYYTKQMSETTWFGIGVLSRFGLGTDYPEDWFGRYNSYYSSIESVSINPNFAWKASDSLSLSVGVEAMWFEYDAKKKVDGTGGKNPQPATDVDAHLLGDDIGYGWNFGLLWKASEQTKVGFHYRSTVEQNISGTATFTYPSGAKAYSPAHGTIILPDMYMLGINHSLNKKMNVEIGAIYSRWSTYDSLDLTYDNYPGVGRRTVSTPKNYKNVWRYQIGLEWETSPEWTWRVGYVYDQSPVPDDTIDYQLPMSDRNIFSIGVGYTKGNKTWDVSYSYLLADDRDITGRAGTGVVNSSTSDMDTNIFAISYSVRY